MLERAELTSAALREAGVATARAAAMVGWDDLANFHAALRAQELNPELRIVVGADNRLGDHITGLLRDCTVLSSSQLAGPAWSRPPSARSRPATRRVTGQNDGGRTWGRRRRRCAVRAGRHPRLTPALLLRLVAPDDVFDDADLVLAVADGTPRDVAARERHPMLATRDAVRRFAANTVRLAGWARAGTRGGLCAASVASWPDKFAVIFAILLAVAISGFTLLALSGPAGSDGRYSAGNVLYLGIMDLTGSALTSSGDHGAEKVAQVLLTGDGMALLPVVTALIVGARLTGRIRSEPQPGDGHVIVVGGGEVGVRVLGGLVDLGFHAVLIDQDQNARGAAFALTTGCRWSSATPAMRRRCGRRASRAPLRRSR